MNQCYKQKRPSEKIRERVERARQIAINRFKDIDPSVTCNAKIPDNMLSAVCNLSEGATEILKAAFDETGMSARAYNRILKVARTIADLSESEEIGEAHILEAIQYRSLDRKYWGK